MPLKPGAEHIGENVAAEMRAHPDMPQRQAVAIALSEARRTDPEHALPAKNQTKKEARMRKPAKKNPDGMTYTEYLAAHGLQRSPKWLGNWKRGESPGTHGQAHHSTEHHKPRWNPSAAMKNAAKEVHEARKKAKHTAKEKSALRKSTAAERAAERLEKKAKALKAKAEKMKSATEAQAKKRREAERKASDAAAHAKSAAKKAREAKTAAKRAAR